MKRNLVLAAAVIGIAFFGFKVSAEEILIEADRTHSGPICYAPGHSYTGISLNCDADSTSSGTFYIEQEIYATTNLFGLSEIGLNGIEMYISDFVENGGSNWSWGAALLDSDENSFATTTSAIISAEGWTRTNFSPQYVWDEAIEISKIRFFISSGGGGDQISIGAPTFEFPSYTAFPEQYSITRACKLNNGGDGGCLGTIDAYASDVAFRLYSDDVVVLSIDTPADQSIVNEFPQSFSGSCNLDVDLSLYESIDANDDSFFSGISLLCVNQLWNTDAYLTQGYWTVVASSSVERATSTFFFLAQSQEEIPDEINTASSTATSTIPFFALYGIGETDDVDSFGDWLRAPFLAAGGIIFDGIKFAVRETIGRAFSFILTFRPYSYGRDVSVAVWQGFHETDVTYPTSTVSVNTEHFNFSNVVLFDSSTISDLISVEAWSPVRSLMEFALWLLMLMYVIHLIFKRLI